MPYVRAFLVVSRCEFMVGGVFFLFFVSALASRTWAQLLQNMPLIALGSSVWYLSHLVGGQVNCLADYEYDKEYKSHLVKAVDRLGRPALIGLVAAESVAAFFLALMMARLTGRPVLAGLWIAGWFFAVAYSIEPMRFKRRGIMNPASLTLVLYVFPVVFGYLALIRETDAVTPLVFVATGLQMLSLVLLNSLEDVPEDKARGIFTPFVLYGIWPVTFVALLLFVLGGGAAICGLSLLIQRVAARWLFLTLALLGYWLVTRDVLRLVLVARLDTGAADTDPAGVLTVVRACGGRNWLHFAILGLTVGGGSALSLK